MTRRLLLLSLLAYGLVFLGLLALQGALVALAIPLVLYMGAALAYGLAYGPGNLHLKATRTLSAKRVASQAPVEVRVVVANEGPQLEELLLEDVIPAGLERLEGKTSLLTSLSPGETAELTYKVRGGRGSYAFSELRAMASDPLGLFRRRMLLVAPAHLLVLPVYTRLRPVPIRPRRTHAFTGSIPSRQGGSGVSFFGVREYRMGDSLRHINWRVTARHDENLFTNEFERERIADVGLILDARMQTDVPSPKGSLFEYAVYAAASLADAFLRSGNRVGLLIYGRGRETTFPGYGKIQRERILHALAAARTGDNMALEHLDYLPTRFFPARSQIVLISSLIPDDLPVLVRLRANGYQVLAISPDPVSFEAGLIEENPELASQSALGLATRIARLERALLLRKLQRVGIRVVDWQVDRPLDRVIHAALGKTPPAPV